LSFPTHIFISTSYSIILCSRSKGTPQQDKALLQDIKGKEDREKVVKDESGKRTKNNIF
jgi:hypothetical protein